MDIIILYGRLYDVPEIVDKQKTGRTYLSMVESYRKKGKKYSSTSTIESFGYLDELQKIYTRLHILRPTWRKRTGKRLQRTPSIS